MPSLIADRSVLKTAPAAEPLTLAEAKAHLRVTNSSEDTYITTLITAARRRVEELTGRALITQTWYLYADEWPSDDRFRLPKAPLASVTSVKYKGTSGSETTWTASGNYIVDVNPTPGEVVLAYGAAWPSSSLYPASPITVEYVAGYGASGSSVPEELRQAMLLLIAHWYEFREPVVAGAIVTAVPMAVGYLVEPYTVEWWR